MPRHWYLSVWGGRVLGRLRDHIIPYYLCLGRPRLREIARPQYPLLFGLASGRLRFLVYTRPAQCVGSVFRYSKVALGIIWFSWRKSCWILVPIWDLARGGHQSMHRPLPCWWWPRLREIARPTIHHRYRPWAYRGPLLKWTLWSLRLGTLLIVLRTFTQTLVLE